MKFESYKILLDTPCAAPGLGFPEYAFALGGIIRGSDPRFAVGVFGGWGSGKTTLMQSIKTQLATDPEIVCVDFSAWRYEKEPHLIVPLLDTVRAALLEWAGDLEERQAAHRTASVIGKVTRSILAGLNLKLGIPGAIEVSFDANKALSAGSQPQTAATDEADTPRSFYFASFEALSSAFANLLSASPGRRIVVFIDDLDRCLPQGALEVLESMKLFFDLKGFIFVVGLDRGVVEWCIDARYEKERPSTPAAGEEHFQIRGSDYINKIFQVPFTLPPVAVDKVDEFLNSVSNDSSLPNDQRGDLKDTVAPHLEFVVSEQGVNPRQLKQFINAYTLQMKVKPYLKPDVVLAMQTIAFRRDWNLVRGAIYAYREIFTDALRRQLADGGDPLEDLDEGLASLPDTFVRYVSEGFPGSPLLTEPQLSEYLYSGEATRSTQSLVLLDAIKDAARLKTLVRRVAAAQEDGPELARLSQETSQLTSKLGSLPLGAFRTITIGALTKFEETIPRPPNPPPSQEPAFWEDWRTEGSRLVKQVVDNLMAVYQSGDIGRATGPDAA